LVGSRVKRSTEPWASNCVGIVNVVSDTMPFRSSFDNSCGLEVINGQKVSYDGQLPTAKVAAVGDTRDFSAKYPLAGFRVCDEGGPISIGDLLCTSSRPGRLMCQCVPDDPDASGERKKKTEDTLEFDTVIRSYTVGKSMETVTFDGEGNADGVYGFLYCG